MEVKFAEIPTSALGFNFIQYVQKKHKRKVCDMYNRNSRMNLWQQLEEVAKGIQTGSHLHASQHITSAKNTFCCCINHSPTAVAGASMVMLTEFSVPQGPLLMDFKFKYLHVQCKSLLLHLRNCTPKSKTNIWVNALTAVILLHDNTCLHAVQLNGMQWGAQIQCIRAGLMAM